MHNSGPPGVPMAGHTDELWHGPPEATLATQRLVLTSHASCDWHSGVIVHVSLSAPTFVHCFVPASSIFTQLRPVMHSTSLAQTWPETLLATQLFTLQYVPGSQKSLAAPQVSESFLYGLHV